MRHLDFLVVHLLVIVTLHHLEMRVFVVRCPIRGLNFRDPVVAALLELRLCLVRFIFVTPPDVTEEELKTSGNT